MSDYITLLGSESVANAGYAMRSAAEAMQSAASSFDHTAERLSQRLESAAEQMQVATAQPPMDLRDYFAAKALQGFLAGFKTNGLHITPDMQDQIAGGMYSMADAMLEARAK